MENINKQIVNEYKFKMKKDAELKKLFDSVFYLAEQYGTNGLLSLTTLALRKRGRKTTYNKGKIHHKELALKVQNII